MTTNAQHENRLALSSLQRLTALATYDDAKALRRAALTLHRWSEHECNGVIQRDEITGQPFWFSPVTGKATNKAIDRERGAIARIKAICERLGLQYYIQGDPKGATLYVDVIPIPDNNYTSATCIA